MAKLLSHWLATLAVLLASALCQASERIVVLTSDVADIVVALGAAPQVVGRDRSSRHPALAHAREIGFARSLNAEPIVPLKPTLVLGSEQAQPPGIWKQLDTLGIPARQVASHEDGRDFAQAIVRIGQWLGRDADARQLARRWQDGMAAQPASGRRYLIPSGSKARDARRSGGWCSTWPSSRRASSRWSSARTGLWTLLWGSLRPAGCRTP